MRIRKYEMIVAVSDRDAPAYTPEVMKDVIGDSLGLLVPKAQGDIVLASIKLVDDRHTDWPIDPPIIRSNVGVFDLEHPALVAIDQWDEDALEACENLK